MEATVETMAARKVKDDEQLEKQIGVRLTPSEYERLEKLAVHLSVSSIARIALRVGLDAIEANPAVLIGEKPKRR